MDPQISAVLTGLLPMLEGLVALGIPGLILGMAAIPAIVIALICWLNYRHDKQLNKMLEAYRADTDRILKALSDQHEECVKDFSAKHQEVVNYYTNNVTLVKNHEKLVEASQTLIVNNTRAMEHLCVVVETIATNKHQHGD